MPKKRVKNSTSAPVDSGALGPDPSSSQPLEAAGNLQLSLTIGGPAWDHLPDGPVNPEEEARALTALALVDGIGQVSLRALLDALPYLALWFQMDGVPAAAFLSSIAKVRLPEREIIRLVAERRQLLERADEELERLRGDRVTLVSHLAPAFPASLRNVSNAPAWLYVQGDPSILSRTDTVAVVGTRRASDAGLKLTRRVAEWLTRRDVLIVSGLAEGIDAAAEQVAVDAAVPTVAVLGHGVDVVFPASTAALRREIIDTGGAVITEYLPRERYEAKKFVQRNRLQAGLASAIVAVEGDYQSGTARTIRFGRDFGRLLLGVRANGSSLDLDVGIHRLIRELGGIIVDLAEPDANRDFAALLTAAMNRHVSIQPTRTNAAVLGRLVAEFRDRVIRYAISDDEFDAFILRLRQVRTDATQVHEGDTNAGPRGGP